MPTSKNGVREESDMSEARVFKSQVCQENGQLDATDLYRDIEAFCEQDRAALQVERLDRKHPLQHVLNSTSGGYVAPTSMKSFEMCPAGYLMNKLAPEPVHGATSVGHVFHSVMERFYNLKQEDRDPAMMTAIAMEELEGSGLDQSERDLVSFYVKGYELSGDYLGGPMDHKGLQCVTEHFVRTSISPLGVHIDAPVYLVMDRLDVRPEGMFVIDYKTGGKGDAREFLLGEHGYLPQMIFYKWGVESEFQQRCAGVYLSVPGADTTPWVAMNVHSLVMQSKVVERTLKHLERVRKTRDCKRFDTTLMRYCNSCMMRDMCGEWQKERGGQLDMVKRIIDVTLEIPPVEEFTPTKET